VKAYWQRIAARIDEMNLRQRAMLFATVALLLVALAYAVLIDPVLIRQKGLIERAKRDQSQLAAVRAQIESVLKTQDGQALDPEQVALRSLEQRVAEVEQALAAKKQGFTAATRLPALLKDLLGQRGEVRLEALRVLPGQPVDTGGELYRHGVEMTLRGGYFELLQYLDALEKLPLQLLWGPLELQVEQYPEVKLVVQVRTLSPRPAMGL
jgi:MSHA biogenesis protein MshJ